MKTEVKTIYADDLEKYDYIVENGEWLEDKGDLSRYNDPDGFSVWVNNETCEVVED
jgi:uncharacterized protein YutD